MDNFKDLERLLRKNDSGNKRPEETIDFKVLETSGTAISQGTGVSYLEEEDRLVVDISLRFGTSGYSMGIEKLIKKDGEIIIYPKVKGPARDSINLQVITYGNAKISIDKKDIGSGPYRFRIHGEPNGGNDHRAMR